MNDQSIPNMAKPAERTKAGALTVKEKRDTVRAALERLMPEIKMALPRHLTPERLLRVTMSAVQNSPRLLDCDRTSLFSAVMTCAQLGLEPDGVLGQAYLVPFKSGGGMKVQFIPGYKGLLTLARNSGEIASVQAHEVCEQDSFSYEYGLNEHLTHRPAEGERGAITHFYAYAKFKDGGHVFEVMTLRDIERVRDASEGYRAFKAGRIRSTPWGEHFVQMGRKTAIRRLANYLPLQVQKASLIEDAVDRGHNAALDSYGDVVIEGEAHEVDRPEDGDGKPEDEGAGPGDGDAGDQAGSEPAPRDDGADQRPLTGPRQNPADDDPDLPAHLDKRPRNDAPPPAGDFSEQERVFIAHFRMVLERAASEAELDAALAEHEEVLSLHREQVRDEIAGIAQALRGELPASDAGEGNFFGGDE